MKAVRIFNPLHVLGNKISVSDINELTGLLLPLSPAVYRPLDLWGRRSSSCVLLRPWD